MKIKVEATKEWKKQNLKCKDFNPERIPSEGEQWEVSNERAEVLLGKNSYGKAFIKVVEKTDNLVMKKEDKISTVEIPNATEGNVKTVELKETTKEKPIKKTTTKKQPKKK